MFLLLGDVKNVYVNPGVRANSQLVSFNNFLYLRGGDTLNNNLIYGIIIIITFLFCFILLICLFLLFVVNICKGKDVTEWKLNIGSKEWTYTPNLNGEDQILAASWVYNNYWYFYGISGINNNNNNNNIIAFKKLINSWHKNEYTI